MPVKRYEVDGNPYDVSDAKEQEFLNKFSNAVLIGVLDEGGSVVEQEKKDEAQDFPTSTVEDADAVQQPMTASQAGFTESPSVDTPSESLDPEPILLDEVVVKANKNAKRSADEINNIFGSSVWGDTKNASDLNLLNTNVKNYANLKKGITIEDVLSMGTANTVTQGLQKKNRTTDQNNWTNKNKVLSNLTSLFDNYQGVPVSELQSLSGDVYALDFENDASQDYLNKKINKLQFEIENSQTGNTSDQEKELENLKKQLDDSFNGGGNFKTINIKEARDYRLQVVKNNKVQEFIEKGLDQEAMMPRIKSTGYKRLSSNGKKIADLIDKYDTASAEDKKEISKQIDILQSKIDEGGSLYDLDTGKVIDIKNASPSQIASIEKSKTIAQTNSPKEIEKMLFDANFDLVALASEINDVEDLREGIITQVKDSFDDKKKRIIDYITTTGKLPEGITKLKGDDPLTKAFNKSLENYDVINKALLTNTNPLKTENKEYWDEFVDGAANVIGSDITTRAEGQKLFGESLKAYGFNEGDVNALMEKTETNVGQDILKGLPQLAAFVGEVAATRKFTGNSIAKAATWGEKTLNAFFKGNKYVKAGIKPVFKGITESLEFGATTALSNTVFGKDESVSESMLTGGAFGFGGTVANGFIKALNKGFARQIAAKPLYYLDKSQVYKDFVKKASESAGGATSFMVGTALVKGEDFDYSFNNVGRTFLTEWGKMYLLGALRRTINSPAGNVNSIYNRFSEDIYRMQRLSVESAAGGKKLGISKEEIKRPKADTNDKVEKSYNKAIEEVDKKLSKTEITEEQANQEKKELENNKLSVENQIGINQAKDLLKQEELNGTMPTAGEKYVAIQKLKNGEDLKEKDSKTLSNMGPELVVRDLGIKGNSANLDLAKELIDTQTKIQAVLNGQVYAATTDGYVQISNKQGEFKALDTKLRKETYKFLVERAEAGSLVDQLKKSNKKSLTAVEQEALDESIKEAELNFKDFTKGGYRYIELQEKLQEDATKRYEADIKKGKEVEGSGVKGTLKEAKTTDEFVKLYEKAGFKSNEGTKNKIAFTDSEGNRVVNRVQALEVRDTSAATHEGWHAVLTDSLKDSSGNVTTEGIKVIDNILGSLTPIQRKALDTDVFSRYDTSLPKSKWYEENLTILSEHISDGRIKFSKSIGEQLIDLAKKIKGDSFKNLEIDATTGKGMFEMLEGFAKGEKKAVKAAGEFAKKEADKSKVTSSSKPSFSEAATAKEDVKSMSNVFDKNLTEDLKTNEDFKRSSAASDAYYAVLENPKVNSWLTGLITGEKGLEGLDPETKKQVLTKVKDQLNVRILKNFKPVLDGNKRSLFSFIYGGAKSNGKGGIAYKSLLDIKREYKKAPTTYSLTTSEGGTMEVADESMSIEDQIDASLSNRGKKNLESQIKTTIKKSGEQFIDENLREAIKTGAEDIFSKEEFATRRELKKALKNKVNEKNIESYDVNGKTLKNTSVFTITKKKIGKLPDFIKENYKSLFHTQTVPISYLVNFERLTPEAEKIFTGSPIRLTNQKLIDKAIKTGDFYVENERTGPMFYSRKKPSLEQVQEFFKVRGRDNAFVNMLAGTAIIDATPGAMKKLEAEDKKIAETALKLGIDAEVQFSNAVRIIKDQKITEITDSRVARAVISRINKGEIKGKIDYTSASIQEEVLKDPLFKAKNAKGFNNIIKKYNDGTLSPILTTKLNIISSKALFANEVIQKQIIANQKYNDDTSKSFIKNNTGLNIEAPTKKHYFDPYFKRYVPELQEIIQLFPGSLKDVQKSKTGDTNFSALSATFAYDGWGDKSRVQFEKDTKSFFGKKFGKSKEAKEIWKGYNEHVKKHPETEAIFQKSDGAQITLLGRATNIINNPKTSLKQKAKGLQGIWKDLRLSNERNNLYHNAIIKTIDLHLTKNYKTQTERNKAIERLAPMLANNRGNSFRIASLFEIFKIDAEGKLQNEHLYESAKYKAAIINLLKEGNVTSFDLAELNKDYISALVPKETRKNSDAALNDIISPEMNYFLKLVGAKGRKGVVESIAGIDIQKLTESDVIKELNTFIHAPSGKLLGDHALDEAIKNSEKPNKTNLETLKKLGVDIKNVKTNNQSLFLLDKIQNSVNKKANFSNPVNLSKTFNKIIEGKTGIKASDVYSKSRGIKSGKGKGRLDIIPPSAEDFVGLLYKTLGKGKEGDAQMDWYKENLIDPFARGDEAITNERNALMRDFKQVKKEIVESIGGTDWKGVSPLTKKLKATIGDQVYTGEDAVRMYIWKKQGMEIPNIDKAEVDAAVAEVAKDPMLVDFANKIRTINRGGPYTAPENQWVGGNIATDFLAGINTEGRAKHLKEWQANVDAVFSKENMNKLEGAFGTNYRKAMENMLKRMKTGKNRDVPKDKLSGRVTDWINNSTGAIMFFNQRSAVLQLMSATNFVNMSDNNIFKAGIAFANQPQYWKDFKTLFNSEYLKNRRGGLEFNVTESEIADIAKQGGAAGVISKILKVGFTPTQIADSFAIAAGGSTFFRNRYKTYLKETNAEGEKVYTEKEAKEKAFLDFKETAEESQQSSRPDKISQQQASDLGRLVLSFANTPSQYARIIKKATLDLKDGRGDAKSNISKIAYYSFLTNLVFNGMQKALFAEAMGDDDEEPRSAAERKAKEKRQSKYIDVANGMISSYLRGTGVRGNVLSTLKDMGLEIYKQQGKTVQDYDRVADAALGFSPPIRYKYIQMKSAGRKFTFPGSRKEAKEKFLDIDSPALMATAQYTSALTNIPLDRALKKINNIVLATNSELEEIQRIGLILGWSTYDLNIPKKGRTKDKSSKYKKSKYKKSKYK